MTKININKIDINNIDDYTNISKFEKIKSKKHNNSEEQEHVKFDKRNKNFKFKLKNNTF